MKHISNTLVVLCFLLFNVSYSQQKPLEISYKRNDDRSIDFSFKKKNPGVTYVIVTFNILENAKNSTVYRKNIKGFSGNLLKLEPINDKKGISFSYSYRYFTGSSKAKPNEKFNYVLPFKNGSQIKVLDLNYLGKRFGNSEPKNWKSIQFLAKPNDTVYASRKGVVVEIKNEYSEDNSSEFSYKNRANYIIIQHADGTLAKYGVLKKNSIMIKLGDNVFPHTPIAVVGTYDKPENSQLRFEVYYLDKEVLDTYAPKEKQTLTSKKHYYAYINPLFDTKDGVTSLISGEKYTSSITDELIEFEMTKREKKKRNKK